MRAATVKKTNASGDAISEAPLAFGAAEVDADDAEVAVLLAEARVLLPLVVPDGLAVVTVEFEAPVEVVEADEAVVVALLAAVMEERRDDADDATEESDAELETLETTEEITDDALAEADDNAEETEEDAEAAAPPIN